MYDPTTPSAATRPSFFLADVRPRSRKISLARSSLPSASISAFLHSIIPAPVFSRSALTAAAVTSAMIAYLLLFISLKRAARRMSAFGRLRSPIDLNLVQLTRGDDLRVLRFFRHRFAVGRVGRDGFG